MSCFCNLFENSTVWLIIIALILLFSICGDNCGGGYLNDGGCGCGCGGNNYRSSGCGCGCGN